MKKILFFLAFMQFVFSFAQSDITVGGTSGYNNALGVYKFYNTINGKPSYIKLISDPSLITTEWECAGVNEEFYMILWTGSDWKWQRFYYGNGSLAEWFLGECLLKAGLTYEGMATSIDYSSNLSLNTSDTPKPGCLGWLGNSTPSFSESDCSIISNLGLDNNILKNNIVFYPNPVKDMFNIKFNKTISTIDLSLLDMSGKILLKKSYDNTKSIELNVTQPKGIYFVKLSNKDSMDVLIKVIKE
ncbi:hypothetical protein GCM10010992_00820 [Cloacibacterium rupense]|uniref:Secretion system C-terminal sorting domain-containing protein n=1 Tax=Cloacibacterium rupense TaxID=517423 RepID=A0ABQ2NFJ8_9FLAO|nr:T9SS type A sorting domain-containing protein [Cloacibacterium rupense]GGP01181.1 hypothetical protein GCM10010992_00820 [Cloacibacterium rupense]